VGQDQPVEPAALRSADGNAAARGPRMPRRAVLKVLGTGTLTLVVAGTGVVAYRGFDNRVLGYDAGHAYDPWRYWRDDPGPLGMVAVAILAANPHNTQPWIFDVSRARIDLYSDPDRRTGALDPLGREHVIGLGCALENLVLAAGARRYKAQVALLPGGGSAHVASVALVPGGHEPVGTLYDVIGSRHSNRGPYRPVPVDSRLLRELGAQAFGLPGLELRWFTTVSQRAALGALMIDAASAIVGDRQQSVDGFAWFRATEDAIEAHRDGLTVWGQDLPGPVASAAMLLPASGRTAGDQFWLDQTRTVHTRTAAAYGVITADDPADARTRLLGGRLLQRVHLAATARGLALQHMNQITERIDREASLGAAPVFADRFAALLATPARRPLASFRIGYPVRAPRLSPRRPPSWVSR
jgi:hypothetical protein